MRYRTDEAGDLATIVSKLESRISKLERSIQLGNSEVVEGALVVKDALGNVLVELGKTSEGKFGLLVNDNTGATRLRLGELQSSEYGVETINVTGAKVSLSSFGIFTANIGNSESTSSTSYVDLATVGPTVSNVYIGASGRCLVLLTSSIDSTANASSGAQISFEVSGATSQAPDDGKVLKLWVLNPPANIGATIQATSCIYVSGLNAGLHTFQMKYKSLLGNSVQFSGGRNLTVIPF